MNYKSLEQAIAQAKAEKLAEENMERQEKDRLEEEAYQKALQEFKLPLSPELIRLINPVYKKYIYSDKSIGVCAEFNYQGISFDLYKGNPNNYTSQRLTPWFCEGWADREDDEPIEGASLHVTTPNNYVDRDLLLFIGDCIEMSQNSSAIIDFSEFDKRSNTEPSVIQAEMIEVEPKPELTPGLYEVDVCRVGYSHLTVKIDFDGIGDIEEIAKEIGMNYSMSETSSTYLTEGVVRVSGRISSGNTKVKCGHNWEEIS